MTPILVSYRILSSKVIEAARTRLATHETPCAARHPTKVVGIRPGEKLHEVLVNEYEMQPVTEEPNYYAIHPEYRVPKRLNPKPPGEECASANTRGLEITEDIHALPEAMGEVESNL